MNTTDGQDQGPGSLAPEATPESISETSDAIELTIKLRNPLDRAVHYISDVRAMIFDPATRHLRVQLSDKGREPPPGGLAVLPRFRSIDPRSESFTTVRLPKTIVKLAPQSARAGLRFEENTTADARVINLEIGWADTPYYVDPRDRARGAMLAAEWEQGRITVEFAPPTQH